MSSVKSLARSDPPVRLSDILHGLLHGEAAQLATVGTLIRALGDRAFPILLFVFAAINVIPALPGTSAILGLPLAFLTLQRMFRRPVSLPAFLMNARLPVGKFTGMLAWLLPRVHRFERVVLPRRLAMFSPVGTRVLDIWIAIIALSVLIPLPFTAMLPAASICLIAIGRMERDGLLVQIGSALGLVAVVVTTLMTSLALKGLYLVIITPLA